MKKNISNKLVKTAVVAALYTVLTVMLATNFLWNNSI